MKKYIPWVIVVLAALGLYAYGDLKRELNELIASESDVADGDATLPMGKVACTEGSTRCQGNTVEKCVNNGWKAWTDCLVPAEYCLFKEGRADCTKGGAPDGSAATANDIEVVIRTVPVSPAPAVPAATDVSEDDLDDEVDDDSEDEAEPVPAAKPAPTLDIDDEPPMTDCTDGKYDPDSALCWEDPPSTDRMLWDEAVRYCSKLGSGWRLPTINELRSLFRSGGYEPCVPVEWEMGWTGVPDGYCGVWDGCLKYFSCFDKDVCFTAGCGASQGPGSGGCYWDAALSGKCANLWSASVPPDKTNWAWHVSFPRARVFNSPKNFPNFVRCVDDTP